MGGALRFAGTMEIAGLDEDINPVRVRGIIAAATTYYPEITAADFDGVAPWRGLAAVLAGRDALRRAHRAGSRICRSPPAMR